MMNPKSILKKKIDFAEQGIKKKKSSPTIEKSLKKDINKIYSSDKFIDISETAEKKEFLNSDFTTNGLSKSRNKTKSRIKNNSNFFILMNNTTASAAEMGIACAYLLGEEKILMDVQIMVNHIHIFYQIQKLK